MRILKPHDLVGQSVAGFTITDYINSGATAWVFRAVSEVNPDVIRALKVVKPDLVAEPEVRRRFAREAQAFEMIDHPAVVRFYGLREADDLLIMEMEFLDGRTLEEVRQGESISVRDAVKWIRTAAEGVGAAHRDGIVHRDLKPSNIYMTTSGEIKVLDFGLARLRDTTSTFYGSRSAMGTPLFMAPEVITQGGRHAGPTSDVYSLALTLYVLLAGRHPFLADDAQPGAGADQAAMWAQVNEEVPKLRTLRPEAPRWLEAELERALCKDPGRRHQDCTELALALELQGSTNHGVSRPSVRQHAASSSGGRSAVLPMLMAGTLVLGCGGVASLGTAICYQIDCWGGTTDGPEAMEQEDPDEPTPAVCSDEAATGTAKSAADAWHECRWSEARDQYQGALAELVGADLACAEERIAAFESHAEAMEPIENRVTGNGDYSRSCHIALAALTEVDFQPSSACRDWLEECESEEWEEIQAEVRSSAASLTRDVDRTELLPVHGVEFEQVGGKWLWDIHMRGEWQGFGEVLTLVSDIVNTPVRNEEERQLKIEALRASAVLLVDFGKVIAAVGTESQRTTWRSRRLVLKEGNRCFAYMPTRDARSVAAALNPALRRQDWASVLYIMSNKLNLKDC